MHDFLLTILAAVALTALPAAGAPMVFESGTERVNLVELYTSEGCSSCPPADRWLSGLRRNRGLWQQVVPLAFHVDYWDHLGWRDRFANASWSERQRQYAVQGSLATVYTPGVILNGQEWRGWAKAKSLPPGKPAGALRAELAGNRIVVSYSPGAPVVEALSAHAALLAGGLTTAVKAGENQGSVLRHDFVVLGIRSAPLTVNGGFYAGSVELPAYAVNSPERAVAIWVTAGQLTVPLQATGGWLPGINVQRGSGRLE